MFTLLFLASALLVQLTSAQILSSPRNNFGSPALANFGGTPLRNGNFAPNAGGIGNVIAGNTLTGNVGNILTSGNVLPNGIRNAGPANLVLGTNGLNGGAVGNAGCGIQIMAEALEVGGAVAVTGQFPIYGTVAVNGNVPTDGRATVNYGCGGRNVL